MFSKLLGKNIIIMTYAALFYIISLDIYYSAFFTGIIIKELVI